MKKISKYDDYLDSRGIQEKIDNLLDEIAEYDDNDETPPEELTKELALWDNVREDVDSDEWYTGLTLIHENAFTDHIKELVDDCYMGVKELPCWVKVDWDATAENCKPNYRDVEIDGETFYFRG